MENFKRQNKITVSTLYCFVSKKKFTTSHENSLRQPFFYSLTGVQHYEQHS